MATVLASPEVRDKRNHRSLQRLGWLLLIWLGSVAGMDAAAAALKLVMRAVGLAA